MRAAIIVAALVLGGCGSAHDTDAKISAREERAIREIDGAWSRALEAKDLDLVMSNYAEDAVFLAPGQPQLNGKADIRAWFERTLAIPGYSGTFAPQTIVVAASGDMAYETGTYRVTYTGADGNPATRVGKHLVAWVKRDGRWRVAAESISGDS